MAPDWPIYFHVLRLRLLIGPLTLSYSHLLRLIILINVITSAAL